MKKQIIAIALVVMLLLSIIPLTANAAGTLNITASDVTADLVAGDTVEVPVSFSDNSGYGYGFLRVGWDNTALELTDVEYTSVAPKKDDHAPIENTGSQKLTWGSDITLDPYYGNGTAFTLKFKITSSATAGDYAISFTEYEVYDVNIDPITGTATGATVTLKDASTPPSAGTLNIAASDVTADLVAGDTVKVPVDFSDNSGYGYGFLRVGWDKDALELTDVEYTALAPKKDDHAPIENTGSQKLTWGSDITLDPYTGNGLAFNLVFKITSSATAGDYAISFSEYEVYDVNIDPITGTATGATVTLTDTTPGPHTHTLVKTEEVPADCENDGTEAYWTCSGCGKMFSDEAGTTEITAPVTITKLDHDWDEGKVTKTPTCTEKGEKTYTCKRNSTHTKTEDIDPNGHSLTLVPAKDPTETEDGNKAYYVCGECKEWFWDGTGLSKIDDHSEVIIPATGVTPTDPAPTEAAPTEVAPTEVVPTEPEATEAEIIETQPEATEASAPAPTTPAEEATPDQKTPTTSPKTGDGSMLFLWIALMAAAFIGMTGTAVYMKKTRG